MKNLLMVNILQPPLVTMAAAWTSRPLLCWVPGSLVGVQLGTKVSQKRLMSKNWFIFMGGGVSE